MEYWILAAEILGIILLIFCSAFFSSSEMALFSLPRAKILACATDPNPVRRRIAFLMDNYNRTLITIILSNMFVNSCISMLNDAVIKQSGLTGITAAILSAVIAVLILLLFGEITPMTLAYSYSEKWSGIAATPIFFLRKFLSPITFVVEKITGVILALLGREKSEPLTHDEYKTYLNNCTDCGAFSDGESDFLKEALNFCDMAVSEVMIPRNKLPFLKTTDPASIIPELIRKEKMPYILVGKEMPDDAENILSVRVFFALSREEREQWVTSRAVFPADFIPENTSIMRVLKKMRNTGKRACLISDEYGGVEGMVIMENIANRLTAQTLLYRKNSRFQPEQIEGGWIFDGMTPLDIAEDISGFEWDPPENTESNTLNGLFCELTGSMPEPGAETEFCGYKFTVLDVKDHRAERIRVVSPDREDR